MGMHVPNMLERRVHPRHDVEVAARYWIDDEYAAVACDVIDISAGGLCVALPTWARLDLGSYATVELPVPGGSTLATTPVKVEGIGGDEFPIVRMRFLDESEVFRALIDTASRCWASRVTN